MKTIFVFFPSSSSTTGDEVVHVSITFLSLGDFLLCCATSPSRGGVPHYLHHFSENVGDSVTTRL